MDTYGENGRVDVIVTSSPVSFSDLKLLILLPAVTDKRKRKTQLHSMFRVSVFSDCRDDTDHKLLSGCGHPCINAIDSVNLHIHEQYIS